MITDTSFSKHISSLVAVFCITPNLKHLSNLHEHLHVITLVIEQMNGIGFNVEIFAMP